MSPIGNLLTQIKNAQAAGHETVNLPFSSLGFSIVNILKDKGFIEEVEKKNKKAKKSELPFMSVKIKYQNGIGAIGGMKLVSKPSRRVYSGKNNLKEVKNGYGIAVVSTSKGLMTGDEAKKAGLGGEVLFEIW